MGKYNYCFPKYAQSHPFINILLPFLKYPLQCCFCVRQGLLEHTENKDDDDDNRARKSRTTLQNKVRLKVLPEQLTLFVNTYVTFKKCIIQ